jgi:hypothetical protein
MGLLNECFNPYCEPPSTSFTFVGLETFPTEAIPLLASHSSEPWTIRKQILADHLIPLFERANVLDTEQPEFEPPSMSFPTADEYRASVGEARYDLETTRPSYLGTL